MRRVLVDSKRLVRQGYDRIAVRYREWAEQTRVAERARYTSLLLERLPKGAQLLDLGCGTGLPTTQKLAQYFNVTGVDLSKQSVELARKSIPNAKFVHADMAGHSFQPGSFDAVAAFYSIIHLPRQEHSRLFGEIGRWLRPGGVVVATLGTSSQASFENDWLGVPMYWSSFDSETNKRLIEGAGLRIVHAQEETEEEFGAPVTFLWIVAEKPP